MMDGCLAARHDGVPREESFMGVATASQQVRADLGVIETVESDNIVRWDGQRLYVEQDVYHNGQMVHRKYRKTITAEVARAINAILAEPTH
jgi:hypothetical protein